MVLHVKKSIFKGVRLGAFLSDMLDSEAFLRLYFNLYAAKCSPAVFMSILNVQLSITHASVNDFNDRNSFFNQFLRVRIMVIMLNCINFIQA